MTINNAITARLVGSKVIASNFGEFAIADIMLYTQLDTERFNIALLPLENELKGKAIQEDRADRRKHLIKNILSKTFMKKAIGEKYDKVEKVAYFSYDSTYNVDYCYFVNLQNYVYDAFVINDKGHILVSKSYKISEDYESFEVYDFAEFFKNVFLPSKDIDDLFRSSINARIESNSKTDIRKNIFLGYKKHDIHHNVLIMGKTNFDEGYETLTGKDKVDLYCFFNMKKHYFSYYALFSIFYDVILSKEEMSKINFIDIGCGPATSGLSFIELIKEKRYVIEKLSYFGVDTSKNMLEKAHYLIKKLDYPCECNFIVSMDEIKEIIDAAEYVTVINSSYLFASESLDTKVESDKFKSKFKNFSKVFILYQNSAKEESNKKWEEFKNLIPTIVHFSNIKEVKYKRNRTLESKVFDEEVRFEVVQILTDKYAI
jgi:hypothetical protein